MTSEPASVGSVRFPAAYGTPGGPDSLLPWSYIEERIRAASNYWITTVGPNARPHARPVDGVWVDGALCFGGSPETRWVRNLMANPSTSVNLSSEAEAIILEGAAEYVTDPSLPIPSPRYPRLLRRRNTRSTSPEMSRHSGRSGRSGPPRPLRGPSRASHEALLAGASRIAN